VHWEAEVLNASYSPTAALPRRPSKKVAYTQRVQGMKGKNEFNCPLCAEGDNLIKVRIFNFGEMDTHALQTLFLYQKLAKGNQ
jgi:hypothetical protein